MFNVLEHVYGDDAIRFEAGPDVFQITMINAHSAITREPSLQFADVVRGWLDQEHLLRCGAGEQKLRHGANSGSGLYDSLTQCGGKGIDDPVVVIGGFGNRVELGAGIRKVGDRDVGGVRDSANLQPTGGPQKHGVDRCSLPMELHNAKDFDPLRLHGAARNPLC